MKPTSWQNWLEKSSIGKFKFIFFKINTNFFRYNELRDNISNRGTAIDSTIDATSGFGERLETFVQNLQGAADRLRENDGISADPAILQGRLAENQAILDSLRQKEAAYAALKESAAELLSAVPQGDSAGAEVTGKLEKLEKLWKDIEAGAAQRGQYLEEVLAKAKSFWSELDQCQKAVDDLRTQLAHRDTRWKRLLAAVSLRSLGYRGRRNGTRRDR